MTGDNAESAMDRRRKHDAAQAVAGYTRCTVRCHVDDVAKVKAYAAKLLAQRQGSQSAQNKND